MLMTMNRLHGENPLAQQNHTLSTHAYDKHLLLKIGKSYSTGHSRSESADQPSKLLNQTRRSNLQTRPVCESSSWDRYASSPMSAVSPANRFDWREYSVGPRTPISESTLYSVDPDMTTRSKSAKPQTGSTYSPENSRTRSERGSYDSAYSASDEHSIIDERPRATEHHGIKRRALSPPHEVGQEQGQGSLKRLQSKSDLQATKANQPLKVGALSSSVPSNNYNSYASSNMLSSASSMTSTSSVDMPSSHEPSRQLFSFPTPANSTSGMAILPFRKAPELANKIPIQADIRAEPSRIGSYWMCSCCPKKPRKFDSEEHLRYAGSILLTAPLTM